MVGYNPQRHKTLFGAAVFGHNVTDGEPIQGHTDFLGVLRIIANVMFFIVLFIGGVKFFEWNDKRKERNELRRSAEKKGMMKDTDPAPTGSDDIELTAVQDVPMASSVPAASSEHEEQGLRPDGSDGVAFELAKLRMDRYADAFMQHGYDHWPEILRLPPMRREMLIERVGMSANHADRFKEQLRVQRQAAGIPDPSRGSASGDEECVIL